MSEYDNRFIIKEKGYRNGVYGMIETIVTVNGCKDTREEKFMPLEAKDEYHPKNINTEKIAKEIEAQAKSKNGKVS